MDNTLISEVTNSKTNYATTVKCIDKINLKMVNFLCNFDKMHYIDVIMALAIRIIVPILLLRSYNDESGDVMQHR